MVTVSYARDIVFDPFKQLNKSEQPEKGKELVKEFISKIAKSKCYQHERTAKGSSFGDTITIFLGITMVLLALAIGLQVAF